MLHYIIQTIAFQLFFLIIYDAFLKKETFFNWNRIYLLGTALLSLIIPFIKLNSLKNVISQEYIISLPEIIIGATNQAEVNSIQLSPIVIANKSFWSWELLFYLGLGIAALFFVFKLVKILILLYRNPKQKDGNLYIVSLFGSNTAFSFFNYIFLGDNLKQEEKEAVLRHEKVHAKQRHTLDLLFFEFLRILFWFNPLVYMCQNRIMSLHEFIADEQAVKNQSKNQYYQNLLSQVFETKNISFINPFFKKSLIKKRIVMLQKSKSKQINLVKYSLLIPMVFGMLVYTSCSSQTNEKELSISNQIEILKSMIKENKGVVSEADKAELFKLINGKEIGQWKVVEGVLNPNANEVPFGVIDQVPLFPGCENSPADEQKKCMAMNVSKHVNSNFNVKLANELELSGRQRINVIFKIDIEGNIKDVRARAPHPQLENEAIRVIKTLPKFTPGEHKGKKVNVPYSLPIIFEIAEEKTKN
ncbi:M56 family metallopeptidase [uncultured Algibacter sp.]|uniref:M56 family metallopeptidase n=1 Tax=uncultured Algibacter sp. TaxID=298659 RepID=UPI00261917E1|nr:M56 family metallopeptidase [uncultured Algibacter sp.]